MCSDPHLPASTHPQALPQSLASLSTYFRDEDLETHRGTAMMTPVSKLHHRYILLRGVYLIF